MLVQHWMNTVGGQIVCEVEMYAYISIRWHLREVMVDRLGICFIDNEACRVALIKRSSQWNAMFLLVDTTVSFGAWIERAPSYANPADLPSRGQSRELCEMIGAEDRGDITLPPFVLAFLTKSQLDIS